MIDDADKRGVRIDLSFKQLAKATCERIKAERDLRFQLSNLVEETANKYQVDMLTELCEIGSEKGVPTKYLDQAEALKKKMVENI